MITYQTHFNNPERLKRFTGLTKEQFSLLCHRLQPLWEMAEKERLVREERKRGIGGGRKYHLTTMEDKLLLLVMFYKTYVVYDMLGLLFGFDASNICRLIQKLTPLFEQAADPLLLGTLKDINTGRKRIRNWDAFARTFPEMMEIIIDATEQKRKRPTNKKKQKNVYSGKKHMHSFKTQITINKQGRIINVSKSYQGRIHDKTILLKEKTLDKLPDGIKKYLDRGYQKIKKEYPTHTIILPYKKNRWKKELTRSEKIYNTKASKVRIKVEHALSRMKKYTILSQTYRSDEDQYNHHFRNVAALCNFRLTTKTN